MSGKEQRMASLLNRAEVKRRILDTVQAERPAWKCDRVAARAHDLVEARVNAYIVALVKDHPSVGKTFKP